MVLVIREIIHPPVPACRTGGKSVAQTVSRADTLPTPMHIIAVETHHFYSYNKSHDTPFNKYITLHLLTKGHILWCWLLGRWPTLQHDVQPPVANLAQLRQPIGQMHCPSLRTPLSLEHVTFIHATTPLVIITKEESAYWVKDTWYDADSEEDPHCICGN